MATIVRSFAAALLVCILNPAATFAQEADAVTAFWTSVGSGVTANVASTEIGWALSFIGLAGGDSDELKKLQAIEDTLNEINGELKAIDQAIQTQTCDELKAATSLADAVTNIQLYYGQYEDNIQQGQSGSPLTWPPGQWADNVINSVPGNLIAINDALNPGQGGDVLSACAVAYDGSYREDTGPGGPVTNPFNDSAYYASIQNLVNYYFGIQAQGAGLLSEAWHYKACLAAGTDEASCDATTGASTSDPGALCDNAVVGTATYGYCQQAQWAVTNPSRGDGVYEQVYEQLVAVGAPYSANAEVGFVWGDNPNNSYAGVSGVLMPRSLTDFTNQAEFDDGTKITPTGCPTLSSQTATCGYTAGLYNAHFDPGIKYASYGGVSGLTLWDNPDSSAFNRNHLYSVLFDPYNDFFKNGSDPCDSEDDCTVNVTGTAGDYMISIGFEDPQGLVITFGDDAHEAFDKKAICTILTQAKKNMPYCNNYAHSAHVCAMTSDASVCKSTGTAKGNHHYGVGAEIENALDPTSFANGYFNSDVFCDGTTGGCSYKTSPGWRKSQATNSKFYQYRWPMLDLRSLPNSFCTVRTPSLGGKTNMAGGWTMCGSDLEEYIDALMPPPGTSVSQALNTRSFKAGHTLTLRARVSNFGAARDVEVYVALVHPDRDTMTFVTQLDPLVLRRGSFGRPHTFRPLLKNQAMGIGTEVIEPIVFRYTFSGEEDAGDYVMLTAVVESSAFSDGRMDEGDIIAMDSKAFRVQGP